MVVEDASGSGPSEDAIFLILRSIYRVAEFSPECLVISLLLIERLRTLTRIPLIMANWHAGELLTLTLTLTLTLRPNPNPNPNPKPHPHPNPDPNPNPNPNHPADHG